MVSEADTPLVKLPVRLADAIDQAVRAFVKANRGLKAHYRWHNADLWMVYQEGTAEVNGNPFILQTRVIVAAFAGESGFQPDLAFMPDILLIAPEGRYVVPPVKRREKHLTLTFSSPLQLEQVDKSVTSYLSQAWVKVLSLAKDPQQADVFLGGRYTEPLDGDHGQRG
jgi:hypothetical protein